MGKFAILIACFSIMSSIPAATSSPQWNWAPDIKTIAKLESSIRLPSDKRRATLAIASFARYYAAKTINGHRMIRGEFLEPYRSIRPGVYIRTEDQFPPSPMDGGCGVIQLLYDVDAARVVWIHCNGLV